VAQYVVGKRNNMGQYRIDSNRYLNDGKTIFEAIMLADQYGNIVGSANPTGMAIDAFGRARTSQPFTLFDSNYRYSDNGDFATSNSAGGSIQFNSDSSTLSIIVDGSTENSEVIRETYKVFSYQPGKSLLILNSFTFNKPTEGIRQRIGYYTSENGVYLECDGDDLNFVIRSKVSGSVIENRVSQTQWTIDKLDGNGPSKYTIDPEKSQLSFFDIEWLGVGSVRAGFIIDGKFIHCHTFHHANLVVGPYMTTASLPIRMEIKNASGSSGTYTFKHVCSTVISEGGYQLNGKPFGVGTLVQSPKDMPTAGTYVPIISIRLKSTRLDSIVLPKNISLLGIGNNARIGYRLLNGSSLQLTGASWNSVDNFSNVEYDISATALSGGVTLMQGYGVSTNQSSQAISLMQTDFKFQLQRNSFTSEAHIFTLAATGATNGDDVVAAIEWEEI
jgi:hypothetical protein